MPALPTTVVLILSLTCSLACGKPPVKPQKGNIAQASSAQQQDDGTISGFLPNEREMEADLASTPCSGLWTQSTYECCFPPNAPQPSPQHSPQQNPAEQMEIMKGNLAAQLTTLLPQYKCQYCVRLCKSKGGLKRHENKCKIRPQPSHSKPSPTVSPSSEDMEPLNEEPALTLAECSLLVSAYIEHPDWQDFLDSGRHATTQTTAARTGWNALRLETVSPADSQTPFPALTPAALETLMQLSPIIGQLYHQLQTGTDPLENRDDLRAFINNADHNKGEYFAGGNHSLVIKWHDGPGYVLKIARSRQDSTRLTREKNLYLWLRNSDNVLLNLTTTPMRAAFSVNGKPVLALRQIDGTARDRLLLMREHHSLNERLDFALSVIFHFCQMYRRFLDKDVLLADRHDDNVGFNEIPLQGRKSTGLDDAVLQMPVMLDLDPYWFGDQESRMMQLHLPTWVPLVIGLLEEVFTPVNSDNQIDKNRVAVIDKLRKLASPVFSSSSSALPEAEKADRESVLQGCLNHWFQHINPMYSELLTEARSRIGPLLAGLNQWDPAPRTVTEWNKKLQKEMGEVLQWLNSWKNNTEFRLLEDFTDEGIIRVPRVQGGDSPRNQDILALLSLIHGKLGCQKCSRTFITTTDFIRHWQLHQQEQLRYCEVCGGGFLRINNHKRVHTREKPYRCTICDRTFAATGGLQTHLLTHSGNKPYICERCGKCFSHACSLKNHLRTHSGVKPYKCQHCSKCFSQACNLKAHLRIHSGDKPYTCKHCDKGFAQAGALQIHLRTHSGEKPYKCELCGKDFAHSSTLKGHLNSHSGDKPYKCDYCGKNFSLNSILHVHLRTHSGDRPYKCEHCGRSFLQSAHLKGHLHIHSGDRPYKCQLCGKAFSLPSALKLHLHVHSDDKPYRCEHCGKGFIWAGKLKHHLHTHSKP